MPYCCIIAFLLFTVTGSAQKQYDSVPGRTPQPIVKIIPNPVQTSAELVVQHFEPGMVLVEIINNTGVKVYSAERLVTGNPDRIVLMLRLQPGIYFCLVSRKGKKARAQMVVK